MATPTLLSRLRYAWRAYQAARLPAPLRGEVTFSDPRRYFGRDNQVYNPSELITRKGMGVLDAMRDDEQVKAAMTLKKHAVIASGWSVEVPDGRLSDWPPAALLRETLEEMPGTFKEALMRVLTALDYGYSVTEKVYRVLGEGSDFPGHVGVSLKTRRPHDFTFHVDPHGNMEPGGVEQQAPSLRPVRVDAGKLLLFQYQSEFGNPYGKSDLQAAYRAWYYKGQSYVWLGMLLERFGIPPVFAMYDREQYQAGELDVLKTVLQNLQSNTVGIFPRGENSESLEFWHPQLADKIGQTFAPAMDRYDRDIARAILVPGLIGATPDESTGSLARAEVHFDTFLLVVEFLREALEEALNEQLVRPLHDLNWPAEEYPRLRLLPVSEDVRLDVLERWNELVTAKVVQRREGDERHVRGLLKFPEVPEGESDEPIEPVTPEPDEEEPDGEPEDEDDAEPGDDGEGETKAENLATKSPGAQGVRRMQEETPQTLYISRRLENAGDVIAWAKGQGFGTTIPAEDMHVTVAFSRAPLRWEDDAGGPRGGGVTITAGGAREVVPLGDQGAVVLRFESDILEGRWQGILDAGGSWDHDGYRPHVTISYDAGDLDLGEVEPYAGAIRLGPEVFAQVDEDWADKIQEHVVRAEDLSSSERRVDFARVEAALDEADAALAGRLRQSLLGWRAMLEKKLLAGKPRLEQVEAATLSPRKIREAVERSLVATARRGRADARGEMGGDQRRFVEDPGFIPEDMIAYIRANALLVADALTSDAEKAAKVALAASLQTGESNRQAVKRLRGALAPFTDVPEEAAAPPRLENVARTNGTNAYNAGRLVEMRDLAGKGLVEAVRYSAVLDSRTTEVCRHLHGRVFEADDPDLDTLRPPNHYMCRSVLVSVTVTDEEADGPRITEAEKARANELAGKGFAKPL